MDLSARMAALREKNDTSICSSSTEATSLSTFLLLYTKARHACYLDRMAGAKALYKYLSPISIPLYHRAENTKNRVPSILRTYEMVELAKILANCPPELSLEDRLMQHNRMELIILECMNAIILKEIL